MANATAGTNWEPQELDAIVADYFTMLAADLAGSPYVKSRHREALIARLGRSNGSIEFKYQNVSAVLDKLGSPWIPGYKPAKNFQNALFDAIDRYLEQHPAALDVPVIEPSSLPFTDELFVPAPIIAAEDVPMPERLCQLVRKV